MANKILPNTTVPAAAPVGTNGAPVTPLPERTQVTALKSAIESALDTYNQVHDASVEAKGAWETLAGEKGELGSREKLLVTLAQVSSELECTKDDIDAAAGPAVDAWCKKFNLAHNTQRTPDTMSTFIGECKRAMHPAARELVVDTIAASHEAWDNERMDVAEYAQRKAQAKRDGVKFEETPPDEPLQRCFAKRYHMVVGSKGVLATHVNAAEAVAKKQTPKINPAFAEDFHALAAAHGVSERTDPKRAARTLEKLTETLEAIKAEFPLDDFQHIIDYVGDIKVETLVAARDKMLLAQKRANNPIRQRTQRSAPKAPVTPNTPTTTGDAIAQGIDALVA